MKKRIWYEISQVTHEEVELEFPFYIECDYSDTAYFLIKVNEDLSFTELCKDSPENVSYYMRQGYNFKFYEPWVEQDSAANEKKFSTALAEFKSRLDRI